MNAEHWRGFTKRVRDELARRGWEQADLAKKLGARPQLVNDWLSMDEELGRPRRRISDEYLAKLTQVLDIPEWKLLYDVDEISPAVRQRMRREIEDQIEEDVISALVKGNWAGTAVYRDVASVFHQRKKRR